MSYRDFSLKEIKQRFGVTIAETPDLFAASPEAVPGGPLVDFLRESLPLATDINTEKARSELIIAPILMDVRALLGRRIGLFSGVEFSVAPDQGLNGVCDFLLSRSPLQLYLSSPLVAVVEAKNEDIKGGIAQCAAAMIAARLFNEREGFPVATVYGSVTSGTTWRFLRFDGRAVEVDGREYDALERLPKILGIFVAMFSDGTG